MNRPPGQGFPYDVAHPKPPEYGVPAGQTRMQCGFPTSDDGSTYCRNTAPCPIHRDRRIGETPAEASSRFAAESQQIAEAIAKLPEPAPGLHETISGDPLPSFGELRERYGDPQDLKPIPKYDPDSPLDLHDQLHQDDQPWSVRSRLSAALGRRALATRLADALPPLLGAELADRLDTLITQAVTETEAAITQQISDHYHEARARLDADAAKKLQEVHDERYKGRPSRFH